MKNKLLKLALILVTIFTSSCVNQTKETNKQTDKDKKEINLNETKLSLDNGKPWSANIETTEGVNRMIELMNSFNDKDNVTSYKKLTESLKSEFTMIFQKCTMKGEAHNQLHNFLIPIKNFFDNLESDDLNACKHSFDGLNTQLELYNKYFK